MSIKSFFMISFILMIFLNFTTPLVAKPWSLRDLQRRKKIIREVQTRLEKNPFDRKILLLLIRQYPTLSGQLTLLKIYRKKALQSLNARIVFAQLLEQFGFFEKALALYEKLIAENSKNLFFIERKIHCLQKLHRYQQALKNAFDLYPRLKKRKKLMFLKQMFLLSLKSQKHLYLHWILAQWTTLRRNPKETLFIARQLFQANEWSLGKKIFLTILQKSKGRQTVKRRLELIRWAWRNKQFQQAKHFIKTLQFSKQPHPFFEEFLFWEEKIYEKLGKIKELSLLLEENLLKRFTIQEALLNARLYRKLNEPQKAILLYKKILQKDPHHNRARLNLIQLLIEERVFDKILPLFSQFVTEKSCCARRWLQLLEKFFRAIGLEEQTEPRWTMIWSQKAHCQGKEETDSWQRGWDRQRYRGESRIRRQAQCWREDWNHYRRKKLQYWLKSHQPSSFHHLLDFQEKLLQKWLFKSNISWLLLVKLEKIADRYRFSRLQKQIWKLLAKKTTTLPQWQYLTDLFLLEGNVLLLKKTLHHFLSTQHSPKVIAKILIFIYRLFLEKKYSLAKMTREGKTIVQKKQIYPTPPCALITSIARKNIEKCSSLPIQRWLSIKFQLLLVLCQKNSLSSRSILLNKEKSFMQNKTNSLKLLKLYFHLHYEEGLQRIVEKLLRKNPVRWVLKKITPLLKKEQGISFRAFLVKIIRRNKIDDNDIYAILTIFCQEQKTCLQLRPALHLLLRRQKKNHFFSILKFLSSLTRKKLCSSSRLRWLNQLRIRYWNDLPFLQKFIEEEGWQELSPSTKKNSYEARYIRALQRSLILRVLALRITTPDKIEWWAHKINQQLDAIQNFPKIKGIFLVNLKKNLNKFPQLQRKILNHILFLASYRREALSWLFEILKKPILEDLWLLNRCGRYLDKRGKRKLLRFINQLKDERYLALIDFFVRKDIELLSVRWAILKRRLQLHPNNSILYKQAGLLLDRQNQSQKADYYWQYYLSKQKYLFTNTYLTKLAQNCCGDIASKRFAGRLIIALLKKKKLSSFWQLNIKILPKLSRRLQEKILHFLSEKNLTNSQLRFLAQFAYRKQYYEVGSKFYEKLRRKKILFPSEYMKIALCYDRLGKFHQAEPLWKKYLEKEASQRQHSFFQKLARQFHRKGEFFLEKIIYYRYYLAHPYPRKELWKQIVRLRKQGKEPQAWALWLSSDKLRAQRCLQSHEDSHPFNGVLPRQLWELNAPYRGPLGFFKPCRWELSSQMKILLEKYVLFLKKHPHRIIYIGATSSQSIEMSDSFLASQRLLSLKNFLKKRGIFNIRDSIIKGDFLCSAREKYCQAYQRQIFIGKHPLHYKEFFSSDVDGDGIVDFEDGAPLLPIDPIEQKRMQRILGSGIDSRGRRVYITFSKRPKGVPLFVKKHQLIALNHQKIHFKTPLYFLRHSVRLEKYSRQLLRQFIAYILARHYRGRILIHYTPIALLPRKNMSNSDKFYRFNQTTLLAHQRLFAIRRFLQEKGLKKYRLFQKLHDPIIRYDRRIYIEPKVEFQLLD